MTISSSLNASVSGLAANASRLATISDNIANSSTFGYKRAETDFHAMVSSDTGVRYSAGGVRTSTRRLIDQTGSLVTTSNATDLAVRGRGFLPVARASEVQQGSTSPQMFLTTTGSFRTDSEGFLRTDSGLMLLGWPANVDGTIPTFARDSDDALEPVRININRLSGEPTTSVTLGVNLPATQTIPGSAGDPLFLPVEYFDNLGVSENLNITFTPTVPGAPPASNTWTMQIEDSVNPGTVIGGYTLVFDNSPASGGSIASVTTVSGGTYDAATGTLIVNVASGPMEINIGVPGQSDGITQLADSFAPLNISKNGSPVGNMTSVEIDTNGLVHAFFNTGVTRTIFQVPLVDLPNPNGLEAIDNQLYVISPESGSMFLRDAGDGAIGDVVAFAREESTTDVAAELTAMIQTQRAYSSNAKVIQTVDEMLQETTNIKR
ncbi:flagellar hook protein FlgE [Roseivivax isoporae]|uniref:Flagellar hook protein FlgE n=1 Tax=Roseivivax isoporae LMG 25204 TaxID=1449351 RepID=X7FCA3_9RHOB|nr:flagellar hook-basal body complex protein [Roseivivax isoporae]ETX29679.1 flagellar hook protein FlgE [Roseivivax isoporae LMG 25204]